MKKMTNAKRRRLQRTIAVISAILLIISAVLVIVVKLVAISGKGNEKINSNSSIDYTAYNAIKPDIQEMFLTQNINSRPGLELKSINGIVIHYTGNPGTDAEANRNYFESRKDEPSQSSNKVSSHFIIGLDGTIIQCIPLNEMAYASNTRNSDTISIECCHPGKKGRFSKNTYNSLVHLAAWLCGKYRLSKEAIIRHYDVTGKMCPLYYVKNEDAWEKLKNDIWECLLEAPAKSSMEP